MYLLRGILGYVAVLALLAVAAHAGGVVAARGLGAAPFRWFDVGRRREGWRGFGVRLASGVAGLLGVVLVLFVAFLAQGDQVATARVEVRAGAAQDAGVRTGDRVLSVDSKAVASFEELRAELRRGGAAKQLEVERDGQKLAMAVTPRAGLIGVMPLYETQALSAATAMQRAFNTPFTVGSMVIEQATRASDGERVQLMGPVGIVREGSKRAFGSFAVILGYVGVFFWPLLIGLHIFDVLTLSLFRVTHPWARAATATASDSDGRLARIYQALLVSLLCAVAYVLLTILQATSFGDGALIGIFLLAPAVLASIVLVALAVSLRAGKAGGLAALVGSAIIPCLVFGMAGWALFWLRGELRRRGYAVSGFVATAPGDAAG
ncbi:MAG: PDZ domain-containing protein [Myxococcota bacterium]